MKSLMNVLTLMEVKVITKPAFAVLDIKGSGSADKGPELISSL